MAPSSQPYWHGSEADAGLIRLAENDDEGTWNEAKKKPASLSDKQHLSDGGGKPPRKITVQRRCNLRQAAELGGPLPQGVINYAYCLVLGRSPDGGGMASYVSRMSDKMTAQQLVVELMNSAEFSARYDVPHLRTAEYTSLVSQLLLGRDPTPSEQTAAAPLTDRKARVDFQKAIVGSKAFRSLHPALFRNEAPITTAAVTKVDPRPIPPVHRKCALNVVRQPGVVKRDQVLYSYCLVLSRWPEAYGLGSYLVEMQKGMTLEHLILTLLQSGEFADRHQTRSLDNAEYVELLYRILLNHDPDGETLTNQANRLADGRVSRSKLAQEIVASSAFHREHAALFPAEGSVGSISGNVGN